MILKPGCRIAGIKPELVLVLVIADQVYRQLGLDLVITSCTDGRHSRNSFHYTGYAADLRIRDIVSNRVPVLMSSLHNALGNDDVDVVLEKDHIHVEVQPHAPLNAEPL